MRTRAHQSADPRDQPVPPPARAQSGRLVPVGTGGARRARGARTSRSSSASATRPATGATSWSASPSRTSASPALMNEHFVCIKVDREERPDLDQIYMSAVQMLTGHGGWPLTVFLTPDRRAVLRRHLLPARRPPRHAGLSARPARRLGGLPREARRGPAAASSRSWPASQQGEQRRRLRRAPICRPTCRSTARARARRATTTTQHGGIGGAPKFPNTMVFSLFLRAWQTTGERQLPRHGRHHASTAWRRAASTISSAAASTATRSTRAGSCRTSRRCSTTTRCSCGSTSRAIRRPAIPRFAQVVARDARLRRARDDASRTAASTRRRTPTARARRASSSSGRPTRSRPPSAPEHAEIVCRFYDVTAGRQLRAQEHPQSPGRPRADGAALPASGRRDRRDPRRTRARRLLAPRARRASRRRATRRSSPAGTRS